MNANNKNDFQYSVIRLGILAMIFIVPFMLLITKSFLIAYRGYYEKQLPEKVIAPGDMEDGTWMRANLTDRNNVFMTDEIKTYALYIDPANVLDKDFLINEVIKIFPDLNIDMLTRRVYGSSHVALKRPISPQQAQLAHDLGLPGLYYRSRYDRVYLTGFSASHLLGDVSIDGKGIAGIEAFLDHRLNVFVRDGEKEHTVRLSVDMTLQHAIYTELEKSVKRYNAIGGTAILMKVKTGEVLSMVSYPSFDPNHRPIYPYSVPLEERATMNRAVQGRYELGSVMKTFTWACALEYKKTHKDEVFSMSPPYIDIGKKRIRELHDPGKDITLQDAFRISSNVVAAQLALRLSEEEYKECLGKFGLLERVPIELVEAAGVVQASRWGKLTRANIGFGYGLAITPMHLAAAYATVANNGIKVVPTLLYVDESATDTNKGEQIVSKNTSFIMMNMLRRVVSRGTGRKARIIGYDIGGKTGTAEKPNVKHGGYDRHRVIATFASVFPVSNPEYVMVVVIDEGEDKSSGYTLRTSSSTAVPASRKILERILPLLGLAPE